MWLNSILGKYDVFLNHTYSNGICSKCSNVEGSLIPSSNNRNIVKYQIGNGQYLKFNKESGLVIGLSYFDTPITTLKIPKNIDGIAVDGIGYRAFYNETDLKSVTLNDSAHYIGNQAFRGTGITKITIPEGVSSIPSGAFGRTELTEITMPISSTFTGTTDLPELTKFTFTKGNGIAVDYTDSSYKSQPWYKNRGSNTMRIQFAEGIQRIGEYTFANLRVNAYTIPASVKEIGDYAFYRNKETTILNLNEGLEKIGYGSFAECEMLESTVLPASLKKMKSNSFAGTDDLVVTVYDNTYAKTAAKKFGMSYKVGGSGTVVTPPDTPVSGAQGEIKLGTAYAVSGNTVEVPIIVNSNPGMASLKLTIGYDTNALSLTGISDIGDFDKNVFQRKSQSASNILLWQTANVATNISATGTLAVLQFTVNQEAASGSYAITVTADEGDTITATGESITFNCTNGEISVADFVYGDVNSSGDVNMNDVDYLTKKIAGWDAYQAIHQKASDVDVNGKVNMRDVAILSRHVAGWKGYEQLPNTQDPLPLAQ